MLVNNKSISIKHYSLEQLQVQAEQKTCWSPFFYKICIKAVQNYKTKLTNSGKIPNKDREFTTHTHTHTHTQGLEQIKLNVQQTAMKLISRRLNFLMVTLRCIKTTSAQFTRHHADNRNTDSVKINAAHGCSHYRSVNCY